MNTNDPAGNGTASGTTVGDRTAADVSGRPLSESAEAKRKRESRARKAASTSGAVGGRGGSEPSTKGNPIPPGTHAVMGEPLSASEAKEQLLWGHVGLAKVLRADIDVAAELDEEFTVAGKNYALVANHVFPPLRVAIRFIAPVVLVAVMIVIWGHIIAATPWVDRIRDWWQRRHEDEQPAAVTAPYVVPDQAPNGNGATPPAEAPAVPPRPRISRPMGMGRRF